MPTQTASSSPAACAARLVPLACAARPSHGSRRHGGRRGVRHRTPPAV